MNSTKWLACRTSRTMLDSLRGRLSERKLRLLGCACARWMVGRLKLTECSDTMDLVEKVADGTASAKEVKKYARHVAELRRMWRAPQRSVSRRYRSFAAQCVLGAVYRLSVEPEDDFSESERAGSVHSEVLGALDDLCAHWQTPSKERLRQAHIVREIVGNPFRPVKFLPEWRTDTAVALARPMYDSCEFSAMPILADALQDAGCDNDHILSHCRDTSLMHVRGCWVVDLVLDKQ
jgi:hypothetical protein